MEEATEKLDQWHRKGMDKRSTYAHVLIVDPWDTLVDDDHRTADATSIASDVDDMVVVVDVDTDELGHLARATEFAEVGDETDRFGREANNVSVDVDHVGARPIKLVSGDERAVCRQRYKGQF